MAEFFDELTDADIHIRDKFQFELKSEYVPSPARGDNTYSLEFFFFVPNALQINPQTYTKQQFYSDQTNFIRLKTPGLPLSALGDPNNSQSPLHRIRALYQNGSIVDDERVVEDLKLYANIVRSAVRNRVRSLADDFHHAGDASMHAKTDRDIVVFCEEVTALRNTFFNWQDALRPFWQQGRMGDYAQYIDEFVSSMSERYAAGLLQEISGKNGQAFPEMAASRQALNDLIFREDLHRRQKQERSPFAEDPERHLEYAVYRGGLLKKFVSEALFLSLERQEPVKTFQQVAAAVAAGTAMLVYLYFLSFHSVNPVLDSTAFVILSVILYAMKDRLKEGLRDSLSKLASGWFPDYRTLIKTPGDEVTLGILKEYFYFLSPNQVPSDISEMRQTQFHTELEMARRLETVLYFRKEVVLLPRLAERHQTTYELNDIFRFNISRFLIKASDPYKEHLMFDPNSKQVVVAKSPKVYHINIILKKTFRDAAMTEQTDVKKYRVILDKDGIKRIEKVT
jgi:hypothetical protein